MDNIESQVAPVPPNLITSLRTGFDAIANQIVIIIFPIAIDLLLWLGPHLQVKKLIDDILNVIASTPEMNSIQSRDLLSSSMELFHTAAAQFNLLSLLRAFPVGIPSLMAARLPTQIPNGIPLFIDITNPLLAAGLWISLTIVGLIAGCFYFNIVVQAALGGKIEWRKVLGNWSWASLQVLSLALALLILFIAISVPSSCAISVITLFGLPLGQFALFLYIGVILWLAFPLLFSAHGIFVNHNNVLISVQKSMLLTRMTLPTTAIFILSILVISEGMNVLWRVPAETSWLTLVGVAGHAFITSALLAASFVYYRDADNWTQDILAKIKARNVNPL
jgi:hypothetical protein